MVRNRKPTGTAMSLPAGVGVGVAVAVVLSLIGAALAAWLLDSGSMSQDGIGYGAMVILLLSAAAGAWAAISAVKHNRLVVGMATGGVYLVLLLGMTALFFGGQYQGIVPTVLLVLAGSMTAVLVGNGAGGNRISRRHKTRTG